MGTIDKLWIKLSCDACEGSETRSVLDKGSMWSGSHWGDLGSFLAFDVESRGGGGQEPEVVSSICKSCGAAAKVETAYGSNRPDGF